MTLASIQFRCPKCDQSARLPLEQGMSRIVCPSCAEQIPLRRARAEGEELSECLLCSGGELFLRKDFPQRVGVTIVLLGFAASSVTWYFHQIVATFAILIGTAAIDGLLYVSIGNLLECYRCHAQYRGFSSAPHGPFDLEVHERFRQQAARL